MPTTTTAIATAQNYRDRYRPTHPDMVDDAYGGGALLCAISGTNITVALGGAVVQGGRYDLITTPLTIASAAAGASNIFNSIVLTYDITHTPPIYARNIAGTSGGGLASVPYTNSLTGVWDFPLCHYERQPGGALVNLKDRRKFSDANGDTLSADDASGTSGIGWFPLAPRVGQTQKFWPSGDTYVWTGSIWKLVVKASGAPATATASTAASITVNTTAFTVSATVLSATIVAPASGNVMVTVEGRGNNPTAGQSLIMSFEVRLTNNAGAIFLATSDDRAAQVATSFTSSSSIRYLVTGLTVGATYYVQTLQRSSDTSSAAWVSRELILEAK
jgi:hypothetical protein